MVPPKPWPAVTLCSCSGRWFHPVPWLRVVAPKGEDLPCLAGHDHVFGRSQSCRLSSMRLRRREQLERVQGCIPCYWATKTILHAESLRAFFTQAFWCLVWPPGIQTPWFLAWQVWCFDPTRVAQRRPSPEFTRRGDRPSAESPHWIITTPCCPPLQPPPGGLQGFFSRAIWSGHCVLQPLANLVNELYLAGRVYSGSLWLR